MSQTLQNSFEGSISMRFYFFEETEDVRCKVLRSKEKSKISQLWEACHVKEALRLFHKRTRSKGERYFICSSGK
jgi:hypothetical protein